MPKIYCAGPLFNNKEKEEMREIAVALESDGYEVFLPQRDGFEFCDLLPAFADLGIQADIACHMLNRAIFTLDVFQVLSSDGLILNINGRVPDEGAMVEAGIAWSSGKHVVIYKNDARTLINGNDNPLLLGLAEFKVVDDINDLADAFSGLKSCKRNSKTIIDTTQMEELYKMGEQIASLASQKMDHTKVCQRLLEVLNDEPR